MDSILETIKSGVGKSCIGVLENRREKRVYLFHTENLSLYLAQILTKLKSKTHDNDMLVKDRTKLKLSILETCVGDGGDEKWDLHYWYEHYKSLGYSFYGDNRPVGVTPLFTVTTRGVLVQLRNRAYNRFTIGVFATMDEAEEWVDIYYNEDSLVVPVWATNKLTIDYFSNK